jgi:hypothetical protein
LVEVSIEFIAFARLRDSTANLTESANAVHGDLTQPGPECSVSLTVEFRQFANENDEDFLSKIVGIVVDAGKAPQPGPKQWEVDLVQPPPIRSVRSSAAKSVKQT